MGRRNEISDTPTMTARSNRSTDIASPLFARLRADHARVLREIEDLESSLARHGRAGRLPAAVEAGLPSFLALLEAEFASHMAAEDDILYPALMAAIPAASGSLSALTAEHAELRQMLARLMAIVENAVAPDRAQEIRVQVRDIAELLRAHIRKEESLAFGLAPRILTPREVASVSARLNRTERPDGPGSAKRPKKGDSR